VTNAYATLGKLANLGLTQLHEVAFILPDGYLDLSTVPGRIADMPVNEQCPLVLRFTTAPSVRWPQRGGKGARPRTLIGASLENGEAIPCTYFGDSRELAEQFASTEFQPVLATRTLWNGREGLTIHEFLPPHWLGRVMPLYKGIPRSLGSGAIRDLIADRLAAALPLATDFIRVNLERLAPADHLLVDVGARGWSIEQLFQQAHHPESPEYGHFALVRCHRIAALCALIGSTAEQGSAPVTPILLDTRERRKVQSPFTATQDQARAIEDVAVQLASGVPCRHLITGDVGTGKSYVAEIIAASAADAGAKVAILLPNARLADQMSREFSEWFPDIAMAVVTGETRGSENLDASVLIGTSALLHRAQAHDRDLVIVDEQHRWSRDQREKLLAAGGHLVEMTATPIPRSQALMQLGRVSVSEMRQTHTPKLITTTLHEEARAISAYFEELSPALRGGDPLLVVYPKREATPEVDPQVGIAEVPAAAPKPADDDDKYSVAIASERWKSMFPGRVATLTSDDDDATKAEVLKAFVERRIQILITTTVVEVGLNLPVLYRIAIVRPELHGLMGLHQLRGRVARNGGDGFCDLICPKPLTPDQRKRLQFFCSTTDGFKLAEFDLEERGAGDLSSKGAKQSGADETFLFGVKLGIQTIREVTPIIQRWQDTAA